MFAAGDGKDTVTDFAKGDAIKVSGYSSYTMTQVGKDAFAFIPAQQRAGALCDQVRDRAEHAARKRQRMPLRETIQLALERGWIGLQVDDAAQIVAKQRGGQCAAHGAVVVRMQHRSEEQLQFLRGFANEHAVAPAASAGHAACSY